MDITYEQAIKQADALKALGQTEVHLWRDGGEIPWHLATDCEPGGTHRLDMATDVWFTGEHPGTGLRFRWTFDLEPRDANGSPMYKIDVEGCTRVMRAIPAECRVKFATYLRDCAAKVRAKGREYQAAADKQAQDAATLDRIAASAD